MPIPAPAVIFIKTIPSTHPITLAGINILRKAGILALRKTPSISMVLAHPNANIKLFIHTSSLINSRLIYRMSKKIILVLEYM